MRIAIVSDILDRIRDLRWEGVIGNTDEMLPMPESLTEFARQTPKLRSLCAAIEEMAAATREWLGPDRLTWLGCLPRIQIHDPVALVHASPESTWRAPMPEANDAELESVYGPLGQPIAVYAHIHRPYVRSVSGMIVANTGSVGLPYDGDRRARPSCWMGSSLRSSAWSMTWTGRLKRFPPVAFLMGIGL
jgi:hypothetical protein